MPWNGVAWREAWRGVAWRVTLIRTNITFDHSQRAGTKRGWDIPGKGDTLHGMALALTLALALALRRPRPRPRCRASALGGAPVVNETVMDGASSEAVMGKGNREPYGFRVEIM